jgi:predicted nucleic acid-binding Zn ribbon protein
MPLIPCHECSGQVSDHARTCPHCGAPVITTIKRRQKAALIGLVIRLVFVIIIIIIASISFHRFMNQAMAPLKAMQQQQQAPH